MIETAERSSLRGKFIPGTNRSALRMLSPAAAFYGASFAFPMACLFILSFWRAEGFATIPDFSFANYAKIADSALYRALILRTIGLGLIIALIVMPLAFALAYLMRFTFEWRARLVLQLILLSMFSGYLVRIYAWRTILGKQGLLNALLQWLGLTDEPVAFLIYSNFAVVVTLTALLLPLAVLPIYSAMCNVSRDHLEAARDLGSSGGHLVRTILLPMVRPGVSAGFAFAFFLAAGDFVTPALVGGAQSLMIGNVIADQFRGVGSNWPLGAALAFVTIAAVLAIYFAGLALLRRFAAW